MNSSISLKIFAKINLSLNIEGREGGMHLLDMILASVDIYDAISISLNSGSATKVHIDDNRIDADNNSVVNALEAVRRRVGAFGADVSVQKNIPLMAGLGGSSADAAGTIVGLDRLLGLRQRGIDLASIALETGSDTAYMLEGGYKRTRGKGECVQSILGTQSGSKPTADLIGSAATQSDAANDFFAIDLVIALPQEGVSTAAAYRQFDAMYPSYRFAPSDNDALAGALIANDIKAAAAHMHNALYVPSSQLNPEIATTLVAVRQSGAITALMTGSGSAVVGVFGDQNAAKKAALHLSECGIKAIVTKTRPSGYQFQSRQAELKDK